MANDAEEEERLRALGIHVITDEDDHPVHAECIRVARRLRQTGRKIVGLVPTSRDVAVPPVAVQLGLALVELTGATVGLIDANVRWPAFAALSEGATDEADEMFFATHWLRGSLALLTPAKSRDPGAGVPQLARVVRHGANLFAHVLVDLTGFELLGDHLAAVESVEALISVGRAGKTKEDEILRLMQDLPPHKHLGFLLVG